MAKKLFEKYDTLLNADGLMSEYEEFYEGGISQNKTIDGKEVKVYFYLSDYGQALNKDSYIDMRAQDYAQLLFYNTEKSLDETSKDDLNSLLIKFSYYFNKITNEFDSNSYNNSLKVFYSKLLDIAPKIDQLFAMYFKLHDLQYSSFMGKGDSVEKNSSKSKNYAVSKIKWLAKTNVLVTLFYDMLNGQDRKAPIIESTKKDILTFITDNFLDAEGKDLSVSTIETYFRDNKVEKRAKRGDRIEIGNLNPKS